MPVPAKWFQYVVLLVYCIWGKPLWAQNEVPTTQKPAWVKEVAIPLEIYSGVDAEGEDAVSIYSEAQINFETDETYERIVQRIDADSGVQKSFSLYKKYYPAEDSVWVIGFSWVRNGIVKERAGYVKQNSMEHFVKGTTFHLEKKISYGGAHAQDGDVVMIEFLSKNLREDIKKLPIGDYRFHTNEYSYVSVISPQSLVTQEIQGMQPPVIEKEGQHYRYTWQGVGKWDSLDRAPSWHYGVSNLVFTPFRNNEELLQWKRQLYIVGAPSKAAVVQKQQALVSQEMSTAQKIATVINYVQDSITYQDYGLYAPKMPIETINDGYGDCKSKSLLGVELLKASGVEAWPLAVNMSGYKKQHANISTPQKFDHCVMQYVFQGDTVTVDATSQKEGDRPGYYSYNNFGGGLPMLSDESSEITVPLGETASSLIVEDRYSAAENRIYRSIIATGQEADALRNLYQYHGMKGIQGTLKGSFIDNGYKYVLGIGFGFMCHWKKVGALRFQQKNTPEVNSVRIDVIYEPVERSDVEFPDFELGHLREEVEPYKVYETLKEVQQRPSRYISHRLVIEAPVDDIEVDSHAYEAFLSSDLPVYRNALTLFEDSAVLEQSYWIPRELSFEQALAYNELITEIEPERRFIKSASGKFNQLLPDMYGQGFQNSALEKAGSILLMLLLVFFTVIGLVQVFRGLKRRRRLKKLINLRKVALLVLALAWAKVHGQGVDLSPMPHWVAQYEVDTTLSGDVGIQIVQKEKQVHCDSQQVFYRNTYEVNRPGAPGTSFLSIYYDACVDTVELVAFHVIRDGKKLSMTSGHIQRFKEVKKSGRGTVLYHSVRIDLFNDLFKARDLVTVAYVIRPKSLIESRLMEYSFKASEHGVGCRYIFRVLHNSERLQERHFEGFELPQVRETDQGKEWLWNQIFDLKPSEESFGFDSKMPDWYIHLPHVYVFNSALETELTQELLQLPGLHHQSRALKGLLANVPGFTEKTLPDKIKSVHNYLLDSLEVLVVDMKNGALSHSVLMRERRTHTYHRAMMFSWALHWLDVQNELFLVRKGGLDSSHSDVLSSELFDHAIVRYWLNGKLCYFDPGEKRHGTQLHHYRKFNFKYGLNLTLPRREPSLSSMGGLPQNRISIYDTVQLSGHMHRTMVLEGAYAEHAREVQYDPYVSIQERLLSGFGLRGSFRNDLKLSTPAEVDGETHDSFYYEDLDSGAVRLFMVFDVNKGDSVDPASDTAPFKEGAYYSEFYSLYADDNIESYKKVKRPQVEYSHQITFPDSLLHFMEWEDITLEAKDAHFKRSTSFSEGLFTVDMYFSSDADYMSEENYEKDFGLTLAYDVLNFDPLTIEGLTQYARHKESGRSFGGIRPSHLLAWGLMLVFSFFPLFGLYKSIHWLRRRNKRRARKRKLLRAA